MQGSWNGGRAHYRRRCPNQYALANSVDHPRSVYLREEAILPSLDAWLGGIFDPANLYGTIAALTAVDSNNTTRTEIERYRAALEAGTDPNVIAEWTSEVQAEQARAQRDLQRARDAHRPPPTRDELEELISDAGDLSPVSVHRGRCAQTASARSVSTLSGR